MRNDSLIKAIHELHEISAHLTDDADEGSDQPRASAASTQKGGFRFKRVQRKLISRDPQRLAILVRIRRIWRQLPRRGKLLFFDVKPVAVKAYGGRRYTSAKKLVLPRAQKTSGRFYLFVAYDAVDGRVYWAFYPGKSARYVYQFMHRLRRWFPDQPLWVALDQDRAHHVQIARHAACHARAELALDQSTQSESR